LLSLFVVYLLPRVRDAWLRRSVSKRLRKVIMGGAGKVSLAAGRAIAGRRGPLYAAVRFAASLAAPPTVADRRNTRS
jgi:hypothetical protein